MAWGLFKSRPTTRPVCAECGAHDIEAHALARWNLARQSWEISDVPAHYGSCSACGNTEARINWE